MSLSSRAVKEYAANLGFNLVGITPALPSPRLDAYNRWIAAQMHGSMGYMVREDRVARRRDLNVILPGVRSIILVALDFHALSVPADILSDPGRGRIAAYAWGSDYHTLIAPRLETLATWMTTLTDHRIAHRVYVDTGAVLERSHAQQAGIGFVGKNTMLIHPRRGSYFFLGEILTDADFDDYDQPHAETMCGSCVRCQVACPTSAFPAPYVLDARRCISYLTIENKGWIERDLRPLIGNWVFGCDICQDVCPFTRFAKPTGECAFLPVDYDRAAPKLTELLRMDDSQFAAMFAGTAIARIKRERLVRNACVAAGNWASPEVAPRLVNLLDDPSPLVRGHAAWALGRIDTSGARQALATALEREADPLVQDEIRFALPD